MEFPFSSKWDSVQRSTSRQTSQRLWVEMEDRLCAMLEAMRARGPPMPAEEPEETIDRSMAGGEAFCATEMLLELAADSATTVD